MLYVVFKFIVLPAMINGRSNPEAIFAVMGIVDSLEKCWSNI